MKKQKMAAVAKVTKYSAQWTLHQRLARAVERWDRPLEKGELEKLRQRGAPRELLPLLF